MSSISLFANILFKIYCGLVPVAQILDLAGILVSVQVQGCTEGGHHALQQQQYVTHRHVKGQNPIVHVHVIIYLLGLNLKESHSFREY